MTSILYEILIESNPLLRYQKAIQSHTSKTTDIAIAEKEKDQPTKNSAFNHP